MSGMHRTGFLVPLFQKLCTTTQSKLQPSFCCLTGVSQQLVRMTKLGIGWPLWPLILKSLFRALQCIIPTNLWVVVIFRWQLDWGFFICLGCNKIHGIITKRLSTRHLILQHSLIIALFAGPIPRFSIFHTEKLKKMGSLGMVCMLLESNHNWVIFITSFQH